jgi:hypothetical protein
MKATVAAVFTIVLFASNAVADKPKTVDEAVQVLKTKWLQPKDREWILRNTKDEVRSRLYMGFGTGMRNQFGLWGDNRPLHDSCATKDPEGCSVVILDRLGKQCAQMLTQYWYTSSTANFSLLRRFMSASKDFTS